MSGGLIACVLVLLPLVVPSLAVWMKLRRELGTKTDETKLAMPMLKEESDKRHAKVPWSDRTKFYFRVSGIAPWSDISCSWRLWSFCLRIAYFLSALMSLLLPVMLLPKIFGAVDARVTEPFNIKSDVRAFSAGTPPAYSTVFCCALLIGEVSVLLFHIVFARMMYNEGPAVEATPSMYVVAPLTAAIVIGFFLAKLVFPASKIGIYDLTLSNFVTAPLQILTAHMAGEEMSGLTRSLSDTRSSESPKDALISFELVKTSAANLWTLFLSLDVAVTCICIVLGAEGALHEDPTLRSYMVTKLPVLLVVMLVQIVGITKYNSFLQKLTFESDKDPGYWVILSNGRLNFPICGVTMSQRFFKGLIISGVFAIAKSVFQMLSKQST